MLVQPEILLEKRNRVASLLPSPRAGEGLGVRGRKKEIMEYICQGFYALDELGQHL